MYFVQFLEDYSWLSGSHAVVTLPLASSGNGIHCIQCAYYSIDTRPSMIIDNIILYKLYMVEGISPLSVPFLPYANTAYQNKQAIYRNSASSNCMPVLLLLCTAVALCMHCMEGLTPLSVPFLTQSII